MALASNLLSGALYLSTRQYIKSQIAQFGYGGLSRGLGVAISAGVGLLTIWFMIQGYRIATGQSRDSMAVFITRAVTMIIVVAFAQGAAMYGSDLISMVEELQNTVSQYVTGSNYTSPENMIDSALLGMNALQEQLSIYSQEQGGSSMGNALTFITGMGQAMPALVSGGLLLLNSIALNLCFVFAPIFILCYLFDQTRPFFTTWVKFTVTTLFSMAVITVVVIIAMKAILLVSATLLAADLASGGTLQIRDIATVQGGLGMMMTTLILGTPPLVTNFFSGAVGASFNGYNAWGGRGGGGSSPEQMLRQQSGAVGQHTQPGQGDTAKMGIDDHNKKLITGQNINANTQHDPDRARTAQETTRGLAGGGATENAATIYADQAIGKDNKTSPHTSDEATRAAESRNAQNNAEFRNKAIDNQQSQNQADVMQQTAPSTDAQNKQTSINNTGIGDDSIALNQKYGSGRMGKANRGERE